MKRIQLRRTRGWRLPAGAVVVSRPSRWGNPWKVGDRFACASWLPLGDSSYEWPGVVLDRQTVVSAYRDNLGVLFAEELAEWLEPLRGHDLACWCELCPAHVDGLPLGVVCADCAPCHATILLTLANR